MASTHSLQETLEFLAVDAMRRVMRRLPLPWVRGIARSLATVVYALGFRRAVTLDNLAHAFPSMPDAARREVALGAYRNYTTTILELLWTSGKSRERLTELVDIPDRSVIDRLLARGRGLVMVSGHFGGWELLHSSVFPKLGILIAFFVQRQRNGRIDALFEELRGRFGNQTIPMGVSARQAVQVLRDGRVLAGLGDQSGPKEAAFVPFFGRPAATHRGMAAFALKMGAPMIMVAPVRRPDGGYTVLMEEVDLAGLDSASEENIVELTRRHTALLESWIRRTPDQWLWMHKRWKHTDWYRSQNPPAAPR